MRTMTAGEIGGREGQDKGCWADSIRQGGVVVGVARDRVQRRPAGRKDADRARIVEDDGVAVDDLEGLDRVAANVADPTASWPMPSKMGFRPDGVAGRAAGGDIGIAEAEAFGRGVVAGGGAGGARGHGDVADADRDAVTGLGALDVDRAGDLVAAAQLRGLIMGPSSRSRWRDVASPGPSIGADGSRTLLVKACTTTLRRAVLLGVFPSGIGAPLVNDAGAPDVNGRMVPSPDHLEVGSDGQLAEIGSRAAEAGGASR